MEKSISFPKSFTGALIAAVFFGAIAPTLSQLQFGDPIENLNVATAMEIRRGGPWLFPTLQGEPRLAKPPLTAWVTAAFLRRSTLDRIDYPDPSTRKSALEELAFEARLPALLAMCLTLAVVYEMGRTVFATEGFGHTAGWVSAVVCGSTLIFLRQCRLATTDAQLALWVSLANLFIAKAVFQGEKWIGYAGAGTALGLALMTKGPIALVQTAAPFGAFVLWQRAATSGRFSFPRRTLLALIVGILIMLVVGFAWYACAAVHFSGARSLWMAEATRIGAEGPPSGAHWYRYIVSCYLFSPWLVWLAAGVTVAVCWSSGGWVVAPRFVWPMRLSLLLLSMPLLLMSISRDRYERYMTPMVPATAVLAGGVLAAYLGGPMQGRSGPLPRYSGGGLGRGLGPDDLPPETPSPALPRSTGGGRQTEHRWLIAHLFLTGVGIVGFVIAGASGLIPSLRTVDGHAWFSPITAALLGAGGAGVLCISALASRRWRGWPVLATAALALVGQGIYYDRVGDSASSRSTLRPVADLILEICPDAELYAYRPGGQNIISVPANDLSIHLNRTVSLVTDMSRIGASKRPQIFAIYRSRGPKYVEMQPPAGWAILAKPTAGGNEDRYVFVREAP